MSARLDHIAVVAPALDLGAVWVEARLGVPLQAGGVHPRMGTHNRLLRLGPTTYLEVIAADPAAPAPERPRWFGLDGVAEPRLAGWIARTESIAAAPPQLGEVLSMTRGDLAWRITVPGDGGLPLGGAAPMLIAWANPFHPADRMEDRGCALERLEIFHPEPKRVTAILAAIAFDGPVTVTADSSVRLHARIRTPRGVAEL